MFSPGPEPEEITEIAAKLRKAADLPASRPDVANNGAGNGTAAKKAKTPSAKRAVPAGAITSSSAVTQRTRPARWPAEQQPETEQGERMADKAMDVYLNDHLAGAMQEGISPHRSDPRTRARRSES